MRYRINELDHASFDPIVKKWKELAGSDEFNSELKIPLEHLFELMKPKELSTDVVSIVISVIDQETNECVALVDVIDAERRGLTKILKFIVSPMFWDITDSSDLRKILANVHIDTYTQVIESKLGNGMQEVKVYGRDTAAFDILTSVHQSWPAGNGISTAMQGRWLSITAPVEG